MQMKPLERQKIHTIVAKELEEYIVQNGLQNGDSLPSEKQIAEELRIGRSSVREGLRFLEGMGLVEARPGVGIFVNRRRDMTISLEFTPTRQAYFEANEIRETLEIKVCQLAVQKATEEDFACITRAYNNMRSVFDQGEIPYMQDLDFHASIYAAAHNDYLKRLLESIALVFFRAWPSPYGVDDAYRDTSAWHDDLYKGILDRDEKRAIEAIRKIIARDNKAIDLNI